jgi:hypothetical protein
MDDAVPAPPVACKLFIRWSYPLGPALPPFRANCTSATAACRAAESRRPTQTRHQHCLATGSPKVCFLLQNRCQLPSRLSPPPDPPAVAALPPEPPLPPPADSTPSAEDADPLAPMAPPPPTTTASVPTLTDAVPVLKPPAPAPPPCNGSSAAAAASNDQILHRASTSDNKITRA